MLNKRNFLSLILALFFYPFCIYASVEVIGSLRQVYNVNQGEVIKGQVRIQNNEAKDQEVRIYQTDLLYNLQEQTFYDEPGANKRSNAGWIQFSPKTVVLKSNESRTIEYEITVPQNDSLDGTYWSVLMVEGVNPIDPSKKGDLNISTVTRYAVQIVNEMNNKGKGSLKFNEPTLVTGDDKKIYLAVDLTNDGDHYISPEVSMELYDENGNSVKTIKATRKGLYPTTSIRVRLDLEDLPSKKTYTAMIVAAGTDDDVFGLEYTLYF